MSAETFISCENLVRIYRLGEQEVFALQGLDLAVPRGEMLGIVGASGSGKSTLLNVIGGLDRPTAGRIRVGGQDLLRLSGRGLDRYRRSQVGFVWQQGTRNLIPYLSALENACLPLLLAGQSRRTARGRATELLETVGLGDRLGHRLAELSGGEQQRVAIAVALANQPQLLLADEPTGEVDTASASVIYDLFRHVCHTQGITTIIVSHDSGLALHVDRVVAVRDGKLASETVRAVAGESGHTQEMVVLDSAGRLQIPKEYLRRFDIQRRVLLEAQADGILIRPAGAVGAESEAGSAASQAEALPIETDDRLPPALRRAADVWERLRERISAARRPG